MNDAGSGRRTQAQRRTHSERRIIRAAIELFSKQGYLRTTLTQVGEVAKCSGGLVSHRFGSKEGLLFAVVENISHRFHEDQLLPFIEEGTAEASLAQYIEIYLKEIVTRENHVRALYVIMGEALGPVPEVRGRISRLNKGHREMLATILERGIESEEFDCSVHPDLAATMILGLIRGVTMQFLADPRSIKIEQLVPEVQRHALEIVRCPPPKR